MTQNILLLPIWGPFAAGLLVLLVPNRAKFLKEALVFLAAAANLVVALKLFGCDLSFFIPWAGYGIDFSLKVYHFSGFILAAVAGFTFLISLYSCAFMFKREKGRAFYSFFLLALSFVNGAVLSDNLIVLLFFWEGLLLSIFGLICVGRPGAYKTAAKALIIVGITDLCMMVGIALTGHLSQTFAISRIHLPLGGLNTLAFLLLMIGAIAKAGSMPFHSWIPDAAEDAPLPFMAFLPAALEKLLGIYFLSRITLDMFELVPGSGLSLLMMIVGSVTILLAVMMALIQKDFKKLLSYHAISQVGYMILGIGTALPVGIVGGLFHMINHAMYKSCLFLTGGAVEHRAGTTDLERLGGLGLKMPLTFLCFLVAAASISGVPPFNGFFSKELVYDAALERGFIFYFVAIIGSFFTAASFLKLGHAAFLGRRSKEAEQAREAPVSMLVPMVVIAAACVFFGLYRAFPLKQLIQPILGLRLEGHDFSSAMPETRLVIVTVVMLLMALINHIVGCRVKGSGLRAVDYIHEAPGLSQVFDAAEKKYFDPYEIGLAFAGKFSRLMFWLDRKIDWVYNRAVPACVYGVTRGLVSLHSGNYATYLAWSLAGLVTIVVFLMSAKGF